MEEGFPTVSEPDDAAFILDRLRGLEKVIPAAVLDRVLADCGLDRQKSCLLSHGVMLWVVVAMGLLTHLPIRQVFKHARRLREGERTPPRNSLCDARRRLGADPVRLLHQRIVRPLATPQTPGAFYHQWRLMAIDGTLLDAPDSDANAAHFKRSDGGRGPGAFPQVRKLSLVELGAHVETALVIGGWQDAEQTLAPKLYDRIPADALLLADRGFYSVADWKTLDKQGIKLLFRIKSNLVLTPIRRLADGSFLAMIYDTVADRRKDRNGCVVRVIEYTLDDPQRTGHGEKHRMMTNLLDADKHPALALILLYHERWEIERVYDEQKTHHDPRRPGKPAHFRSETPMGVEQEAYAISLGHFVVRALMTAAAAQTGQDPDRLSYTGCFRILQARLPECDRSGSEGMTTWVRGLLWEMSQERIEPRRNRINPRVVKRKMSKYAKKRPHHRHPPPLTQTFAETVHIG